MIRSSTPHFYLSVFFSPFPPPTQKGEQNGPQNGRSNSVHGTNPRTAGTADGAALNRAMPSIPDRGAPAGGGSTGAPVPLRRSRTIGVRCTCYFRSTPRTFLMLLPFLRPIDAIHVVNPVHHLAPRLSSPVSPSRLRRANRCQGGIRLTSSAWWMWTTLRWTSSGPKKSKKMHSPKRRQRPSKKKVGR